MADPIQSQPGASPDGPPAHIDPELDRGLRLIDRGFSLIGDVGVLAWLALMIFPFILIVTPLGLIGYLIGAIRIWMGLGCLRRAGMSSPARRTLRLAQGYFLLIPAAGLVFLDPSSGRAVVYASGLTLILFAAALVATALALRETARERAIDLPHGRDARARIRETAIASFFPLFAFLSFAVLFLQSRDDSSAQDQSVALLEFSALLLLLVSYVSMLAFTFSTRRLAALADFIRVAAGGKEKSKPGRATAGCWDAGDIEPVPAAVRDRYTRRMWGHVVRGLQALRLGLNVLLGVIFACFCGWLIAGISPANRFETIAWIALLAAPGAIAGFLGLRRLARAGIVRRISRRPLRAAQAAFAVSAAGGLAPFAPDPVMGAAVALACLLGILPAALAGTTLVTRRLAAELDQPLLARLNRRILIGWIATLAGTVIGYGLLWKMEALHSPTVEDSMGARADGFYVSNLLAFLVVAILAGSLRVNVKDLARACELPPKEAKPG
jgi:hypothetical protein